MDKITSVFPHNQVQYIDTNPVYIYMFANFEISQFEEKVILSLREKKEKRSTFKSGFDESTELIVLFASVRNAVVSL